MRLSPCRYGTGQRPLMNEPHLGVDMPSSGESSSGFTSQESTMERCKTGIPPFLHLCCRTSFSAWKGGFRSVFRGRWIFVV